jgi:hypothetical protein
MFGIFRNASAQSFFSSFLVLKYDCWVAEMSSSAYTKAELKAIARTNNLVGYTSKLKEQLFQELQDKGCLPRTTDNARKYDLRQIQWVSIRNPDRKTCMQDWEAGENIGTGSCSSITEACRGSQCDYVLKVSEIAPGPYRFELFKREVFFLRQLQDSGIVPKLIDAWICGDYGYSVLERYDGNAEDVIVKVRGKEVLAKAVFDKMVHILDELSR